MVLIVFAAISVYPALNGLSISLRPGDRLRSNRSGDHPAGLTLASYQQLLHRAALPALAR